MVVGIVPFVPRHRGPMEVRLDGSSHRSLNDLVELAAVQPDTATLGTIVNLDALSSRHDEIRICASGTFHRLVGID